jgi:hypothetical protein
MAKTLTVLDILQDEEKALLDRLAFVRRRITSIQRGDVCVDAVRVTVAVGAQSVSVAGVKGAGMGG